MGSAPSETTRIHIRCTITEATHRITRERVFTPRIGRGSMLRRRRRRWWWYRVLTGVVRNWTRWRWWWWWRRRIVIIVEVVRRKRRSHWESYRRRQLRPWGVAEGAGERGWWGHSWTRKVTIVSLVRGPDGSLGTVRLLILFLSGLFGWLLLALLRWPSRKHERVERGSNWAAWWPPRLHLQLLLPHHAVLLQHVFMHLVQHLLLLHVLLLYLLLMLHLLLVLLLLLLPL
mmetsp:Transcript_48134/g.114394  ORF Transcript_48134/g.114394 Transcript_48134/m.114394 type:complete len:230 (+) Transcript_48134:334-1023(+)